MKKLPFHSGNRARADAFSKALLVVLASMAWAGAVLAQGPAGAGLWEQYVRNPETHPNIPNNSYAGYRRGEAAIPTAPVKVNVKQFGAKGDGQSDDWAAFAAALKSVSKGGVVLVPAGTYKLSGLLHLKDSGVVLRGEGRGKTTLDFQRPLINILHPLRYGTSSQWSWAGGLIWIGPADTFDAAGKVAKCEGPAFNSWEFWRNGKPLAAAAGKAKRGEFTFSVESANALTPGMLVLMTWDNPADASLLKEIAGHPLMASYDWKDATNIMPPSYPRWQWPVEIKSVRGNQITLVQPLRVDIRPEWKVTISDIPLVVREAGIEDLKIKLHAPMAHEHLMCMGWNGLYANRAYNCWVRNVEFESTENGVILAAAKNVTIDRVLFSGPEMQHHSTAIRVNSHDNLFQNFVVDGPSHVKHGINIEWLSSGNVYSKGRMMKGTFDSHRALSFDLLRTEISLANAADGPGGAGNSGPFLGRHVVHWNVEVKDSPRRDPGEYVYMPEAVPMGALVGIRGAKLSAGPAWAMPKGDKGAIIAEEGVVPNPPNLYEAQLKLRLGLRPAVTGPVTAGPVSLP